MLLNYVNGKDGAQGGPPSPATRSRSGCPGGNGAPLPVRIRRAWRLRGAATPRWPAQQAAIDQILYRPTDGTSRAAITGARVNTACLRLLSPAGGAVALDGMATPPERASIATVGNAAGFGGAMELDMGDVLTGRRPTMSHPGGHEAASASTDAQPASGGLVSFAPTVGSAGATPVITAHIAANGSGAVRARGH